MNSPDRMVKILAKFENLRVFSWCIGLKIGSIERELAKQVAVQLSKSCFKLEHVYSWDPRSDGFFSGLTLDTITCVHCKYLPSERLKNCDLKYFSDVSPTPERLKETLKRKSIHQLTINDYNTIRLVMKEVVANGAKLESLAFRNGSSALVAEQVEEICRSIPLLKSFECSGPVTVMSDLRHLRQLEKLSWFETPRSYWFDMDESHVPLQQILSLLGYRLTRLRLDMSALTVDDVADIATACPNLVELLLHATFPTLTDDVFEPLLKLKRLRRLVINRNSITAKGVDNYLKTAAKIREFRFAGFTNQADSDELKALCDEYRKRHPKRNFRLIH